MNDPIDRLRAANPVTPSDSSLVDRDEIFAAVTASEADSADEIPRPMATEREALFSAPPSQESVKTELRRRPRSGRILAGAAAAVVAGAVGFGAVSLIPSSSAPAAAAMAQVAQATEAADSGTVTVSIGLEDEAETFGVTLFSRFDGRDFSATLIDAAGQELDGLPTDVEVRFIDGEVYVSDGERWIVVDDPNMMTALEASGFPLDVGSASAAVVDLVEAADGVVETEPGRFQGTVTVAEVKEVAADHPSLEFFVPELFDTELDQEELEIDLVSDGSGAVDMVTISAVPEVEEAAGGEVEATLVIDFEDLGTEQIIERPADAEPLDLGSFGD